MDIIGEKCGTITVSVYKNIDYKFNLFQIKSDNNDLEDVVDTLEGALNNYKIKC